MPTTFCSSTLATREEIRAYLFSLKPNDEKYNCVKRFMADYIYQELEDAKNLYKSDKLPFDFKIEKSVVDRKWSNFIRCVNNEEENKNFEAEKVLLMLGEKISKAKLFYYGFQDFRSYGVHKAIELISEIEKEAEKNYAKEYVIEDIQPIKDQIKNHRYLYTADDKVVFHEGLFLYDLESRVYSLKNTVRLESDVEEIARRIYDDLALGERIGVVINKTMTDNKNKENMGAIIDRFNKKIYEMIEKIDKETVECFYLLVFFENELKERGDMLFTDEELKLYKKRFEMLKKCFDKIKERLPPEKKERENEIIRNIEENICTKLDVEATKKAAVELIGRAREDLEPYEIVRLISEAKILLIKMQNKNYYSLDKDFKELLTSYFVLIKSLADKLEKSGLSLEERYKMIVAVEPHPHSSGDTKEYNDAKARLDSIRVNLARDMLASISETKLTKNNLKFWTGVGTGVASLTVFGVGLALLPWLAPFGIALFPVSMKLIKDGVSELRDKHDEFVRVKKRRGGMSQITGLKKQHA